MVRISNCIDFIDHFADCIPVVSTVKNSVYLCFQKLHPVNDRFTPTHSWRNHLKVCILTKNETVCYLSLIPVIGNIYCLAHHIFKGVKRTRRPAVDKLSSCIVSRKEIIRKHRFELIQLLLCSETEFTRTKLVVYMAQSSRENDFELFKFFFNLSSDAWTAPELDQAMTYGNNLHIFNYIFDHVNFNEHQLIIENLLIQKRDMLENSTEFYRRDLLQNIVNLLEKKLERSADSSVIVLTSGSSEEEDLLTENVNISQSSLITSLRRHMSGLEVISECKLKSLLNEAIGQDDPEIFKLIYVSNTNGWKCSHLVNILTDVNNVQILEFLLSAVDFTPHISTMKDIYYTMLYRDREDLAELLRKKFQL